MKQKEKKSIFRCKAFILFASIPLVVFSAQSACSKENSRLAEEKVELRTRDALPVDELMSALSEGGLTSPADVSGVALYLEEQAPEEKKIERYPEGDSAEKEDVEAIYIEDLEKQGGLSTKAEVGSDAPTVFELATKFLERVIFRGEVEFEDTPKFKNGMEISGTPVFDEDTAGYAVIKKGNQSVVVEFDQKYDEPPIVTATLSLQKYEDPDVRAAAEDLLLISDVRFIVTKVSKTEFEIMMDRIADSDIPFSWHALAVEEPKVHKKKGTTLENAINSLIENDFWTSQFGDEDDSAM